MVNTLITGREPRLSSSHGKRGQRRLSLHGLATMLNALPPEAVALPVVAEALRSDAFYVRYSAAKLLARRGDRDARMLMQEVLTNGAAPARASVARHLYGYSWYSAEPLVRLALADLDRRVRESVMYALCDLRVLNAYQLIADVLQDEEDDVRMAAAWGLRDCQDPAAVAALEAVMLADDPEVRVKALEGLGANGTPAAIPVVHKAIDDPHPDVAYAATLSLLELAGESCLPELCVSVQRSSSRSAILCQHILRGFFHATNYLKIDIGQSPSARVVIDTLDACLNHDAPQIRVGAFWLLAWIRHERAPDIVRWAYQREADGDTRAHMLRIAVSLLSEAGEELLQDALHSADSQLRDAAELIVRERAQRGAARAFELNTAK
jgi:HEAT repeat protein